MKTPVPVQVQGMLALRLPCRCTACCPAGYAQMASLVCRWLEMAQDGDAPAGNAAGATPGAAAGAGTLGAAAGEGGGGGPAGAAGSQAAQQLDEAYYLRQLAKVGVLRSLSKVTVVFSAFSTLLCLALLPLDIVFCPAPCQCHTCPTSLLHFPFHIRRSALTLSCLPPCSPPAAVARRSGSTA